MAGEIKQDQAVGGHVVDAHDRRRHFLPQVRFKSSLRIEHGDHQPLPRRADRKTIAAEVVQEEIVKQLAILQAFDGERSVGVAQRREAFAVVARDGGQLMLVLQLHHDAFEIVILGRRRLDDLRSLREVKAGGVEVMARPVVLIDQHDLQGFAGEMGNVPGVFARLALPARQQLRGGRPAGGAADFLRHDLLVSAGQHHVESAVGIHAGPRRRERLGDQQLGAGRHGHHVAKHTFTRRRAGVAAARAKGRAGRQRLSAAQVKARAFPTLERAKAEIEIRSARRLPARHRQRRRHGNEGGQRGNSQFV
jgi:hypothetical protein